MYKRTKTKVNLTIRWIFAIISAIIISATMILTFTIIFVILKFSFSPLTGAITSSSFIAVLSIVVGTIISSYVSSKMLRPILKINDAAKKVATGDYSVRLEENSIANEIRQIAVNFNVMVRELSNTETLANDFISNVSHEFKTPLSAISGYATLLQDDTLIKEEREKYLDYILENTGRLTNLTQNILSLSRLENQEIVFQKEHFLLDEQIRRVLLNYEGKWEDKNLTIDLNLERIMFYGNQSLLAQVWSNLIDNAIKFSKQDGTLSIDCVSKEGSILVTVKDDGAGMEDEVKKHAFDKFYQGDRSHSEKGNGLGLALVQRVVTLCGGTVALESEKGKGTSITVLFSLNNAQSHK
jgi:signal transduction histidine kinase